MAQTPVAADLHEALDVLRPLAAEVALDLEVLVDVSASFAISSSVRSRTLVSGSSSSALQTLSARPADPVDVGEADLDALLARNVDSSDARHASALLLLVPGIDADHHHVTRPADHANFSHIGLTLALTFTVPSGSKGRGIGAATPLGELALQYPPSAQANRSGPTGCAE